MARDSVSSGSMSNNEHKLSRQEAWIIRSLEDVLDQIYAGNIEAIGFCSVDGAGNNRYFYFNRPDLPMLDPALSKLVGLYSNMRPVKNITAPYQNRSYEVH